MSNPCECCQRKLKFIRQINGNFMHSMVIPEWFLNQFGGKIWRTVQLEAPNGEIYDVGVTENMSRTILKSGWAAFVDANQIEENYSLMFRYLGNARFEITIFDSNGKEKALCCAGMRNASGVQKSRTFDVHNSSSSCGGTTQSTESKGSDSDGNQKEISYSSAEESLSVENCVESDDLSNYYVLSGRCDLTEAQKLKLHAFVEKIRPQVPVLVVLMKKSNVKTHGDLVICKDYAQKYLPCKATIIILQVPDKNKVWKCKFQIRPSGLTDAGRRNLYFGNFIHDNRVREGDICLFQPMTNVKHKKITITVHLLRKTNIDHSPGGRIGFGSNNGRRSAKMGVVKDDPPIDGEEYSSEHQEDGVPDDSEGDPEPPFMLPSRSRLTTAQEKRVLEKLEDIESELPIYVATMSKINVCHGRSHNPPILNFGFRYAARYLGEKFTAGKCNAINLVLWKEGKRKSWPTKLRYTHDKRGRSHQMRVHKGWSSFARDNRLREGDLCLFQLMENEKPLTMMVYIIRHEKC